MGVVNVTPDSFSDGGQWFETDVAIAHGRTLLDQGADIIDVGGESTRPGAERISEAEELQRVMPVARAMIDTGVPVSVDTMRAAVAETADRKSTRLNSSHVSISYAVFCLKKKTQNIKKS